METRDLHYQPIARLAASIQIRELSCEDLCRSTFERIKLLDPGLHSFAALREEDAIAEARKADDEISRGQYRGPLHGIPIALKDLIFTEDCVTQAGTVIHRDFRPPYDATVVQRLKSHGAIIVGKAQMTEAGGMLHHPEVTPPLNPFGRAIWAGASSSGSAVATAAGLCAASLASDTGGSIRSPSACNGLTGLRPSWGRVSRFGIFDLAQSYDTVGPIARCAEDVAIVLSAIAGIDAYDPTSISQTVPDYRMCLDGIDGARAVRIGIDTGYIAQGAAPETLRMIEEVQAHFADLGAQLTYVEMPGTDELCLQVADLHAAELALAHAATYPARADLYGPWLAGAVDRGRAMDPIHLAAAGIARARFASQLDQIFAHVDALLLPVFAGGTPTRAEAERMAEDEPGTIFRFTIPSGAAGIPSLTLPAPQNADGRPTGFQLLGRRGEEQLLLRLGHALQCLTDWHLARPPL
ncbi:amidase [Mesorhizobium sp.]|uniref:amidase n=1 Tax=Mesorhizobium sp. TaxID=1871066 RepID=UPI000FE31E18|nr:amidase [Mesorhizobium sp.]RWH67919.1 MAG: amidase [Mesorhizobium sp.]RWL23498.1 MAG: amidase [Mesorhizobium sp.]RWL25542.1 MAG: amidase [Mesorhizobium sp.]RWL33685.1 MAG: amidase [Mesorhizobium sp.]RWL47843.1 MAG: amidase [Mesorhizobium sp.]